MKESAISMKKNHRDTRNRGFKSNYSTCKDMTQEISIKTSQGTNTDDEKGKIGFSLKKEKNSKFQLPQINAKTYTIKEESEMIKNSLKPKINKEKYSREKRNS